MPNSFPEQNHLSPVLITNNHIINELMIHNNETTKLFVNNKEIEINFYCRKYYTSKDYDITIIELLQGERVEYYLQLDNNINRKANIDYRGKSIYILHYPGRKDISVSYGIIKTTGEDDNFNFSHLCNTEKGSSGSPILDISTIGIHKEGSNHNYNVGLFIKYGINECIKEQNNYIKY